MRVKRLGELAVAVYNPEPYYVTNDRTEAWNSPKRTPLVCAISRDDAASFTARGASFVNGGLLEYGKSVYMLEDDPADSYCYPTMIETKDGFLAAYYHSSGSRFCLKATRVLKICKEELDG